MIRGYLGYRLQWRLYMVPIKRYLDMQVGAGHKERCRYSKKKDLKISDGFGKITFVG